MPRVSFKCKIEMNGRVLTDFGVSEAEAKMLALNFGMPWPAWSCSTSFGDIDIALSPDDTAVSQPLEDSTLAPNTDSDSKPGDRIFLEEEMVNGSPN